MNRIKVYTEEEIKAGGPSIFPGDDENIGEWDYILLYHPDKGEVEIVEAHGEAIAGEIWHTTTSDDIHSREKFERISKEEPDNYDGWSHQEYLGDVLWSLLKRSEQTAEE